MNLVQRILGLQEAEAVSSTPDTVTIGGVEYRYYDKDNIAVAIVIGSDQVFELKGGGHQEIVSIVNMNSTLRMATDADETATAQVLMALTSWYPPSPPDFGYNSFHAGRIWPKLKIFNFWGLRDKVVPKYLAQIEGAALLANIRIEEYSFSFGDIRDHLIPYSDLRKKSVKTVSPGEQKRLEKEAELAQQAHLMNPNQKFLLQKAGILQKPKEFGAGLMTKRASDAGYNNPAAWNFARRQGLGDSVPQEIVTRLLAD